MESSLSTPRKVHLKIRPTRGWAALNLGQIWQFRDLLTSFAARDVKLRYRQTALGVLWVLFQPLLGAGIFAFVFNKVAGLSSDGVPALLFSFVGLLGWNVFGTTLTKSSTCLIQNSQLISKVFFPRLILPLSTVFGALIDFGVGLALLPLLLLFYGVLPGAAVLLLPVWLLLIALLALGIGLFAAAFTVSYRDVQYVVPVFTQMLLYASPVAYAVSAVPERFRPYYFLNPLSGLFEGLRWSLLGTGSPRWEHAAFSAACAVVVFAAGAFAFKRMERRFADVI